MQDEEINMYADLDAGEPAYLPKEEVSSTVGRMVRNELIWEQAQSEEGSDAISQAGIPPPGGLSGFVK